jgi:pimeloyl-ACP methyl ester carboxylesterase/DNA-binding CsgD family transcriptional regulator
MQAGDPIRALLANAECQGAAPPRRAAICSPPQSIAPSEAVSWDRLTESATQAMEAAYSRAASLGASASIPCPSERGSAISQQIRFCRARDGARIAVAMSGKGAPLLCVPPWFSHAELDAASPIWMHWLRELSLDCRCIRYDQRGTGLSDRIVPPPSFEDWLGDLETVVDTLGLKRFALLGVSQGAALAIAYATRHRQRVSHLTILGGCTRGPLYREGLTHGGEEAALLIKLARIGWGRENPAFRQLFTTMLIPDSTLEQQRWLNDLQKASAAPEIAAAALEVLHRLDLTSLAQAVRVPTLVFHARGDGCVPFEEGRRLAALIPAARFVPLDTRNHLLLENDPAWKHFLTELRALLAHGSASTLPNRLISEIGLTPAEVEVLNLLARGLHNRAIAAQLGKTEKTVRNQVSSILSKFHAHSRAEVVALARDAGIGNQPFNDGGSN